jgi:hypothetical protein
MNELYEPEAYFQRTEALYLEPSFEIGLFKFRSWLTSPRLLPAQLVLLCQAIGLFLRLMTRVPEPALRREYRKRLWRFLKVHRRPGLIFSYVFHMTMHYHARSLAQGMVAPKRQLVNSW